MSDKDNFNDKDNDKIEDEFDFLDDEDAVEEDSFDPNVTQPENKNVNKSSFVDKLPIDSKKAMAIGAVTIALIGAGAYFLVNQPSGTQEFVKQDVKPNTQTQITQKTLEEFKRQAMLQEQKEQQEEAELRASISELKRSFEQQQGALSPDDLKAAIQTLDQDITSNMNQIRNIQYSLKELSKAMTAMNKNIGVLDNRIINLTRSLEDVTYDVSGVKQIIAEEDLDLTSQKVINETIKYQEPEFTVHAVIPGRAWLKNKEGKIVTITEGDNLGKYGQIAVIDVVNNIVSTSSGTSFR